MSSASAPPPPLTNSLPADPIPSAPPSDPIDPPPVSSTDSAPPGSASENPPPSASESLPQSSQPPSAPLPSEPQPSSTPPPASDTSAPPTSTPPTSPSRSINTVVTTDENGGLVTKTIVISYTPSASSSTLPAGSSGGSSSFFDNKGAVAGVFTVVGLVALGLIFMVVTWGIRRRRAKQFDRDVDEAAREAAHTNPPTFLDDPADDGDRSYATQNYVCSDNSHGTFGQPPMDHYPQEAYSMAERNYGYPSAGAAGVGVMRARSRREFDDTASAGMAGYGAGGGLHNGFGETSSPYPVFAAPGGNQPRETMYENRYPDPNDYGNAAHTDYGDQPAAPTMAAAPVVNRNPSQPLARQKSQGSRSLVDGYYGGSSSTEAASQPESYASRYQPGYRPDPSQYPIPPLPSNVPQTSAAGARTSVYRDDDDPYGGYSSQGHTNPGDQPINRHSVLDDSDDDSEDRHDNRRVLKVANE